MNHKDDFFFFVYINIHVHFQITDQEIIGSVTPKVIYSLYCPFKQNFKLCEGLATTDGLGNSGFGL